MVPTGEISPCSSRKRANRESSPSASRRRGVADGRYEIVLSATDGIATVTTAIPVLVDRTVRGFAGTPAAVSPNGDGIADALTFGFELTRAASVRLDVAQAGKTLVPSTPPTFRSEPQSVSWSPSGLKDGKYAAVFTATNDLGTVVHTMSFRIDTVAPTLRALSFRKLRFRDQRARDRPLDAERQGS